ncbi:hypothetical protein MMC16_002926 [Acarospora aff. strigata]|nr:hypothetical protein [Acarospora aff. strigata]
MTVPWPPITSRPPLQDPQDRNYDQNPKSKIPQPDEQCNKYTGAYQQDHRAAKEKEETIDPGTFDKQPRGFEMCDNVENVHSGSKNEQVEKPKLGRGMQERGYKIDIRIDV